MAEKPQISAHPVKQVHKIILLLLFPGMIFFLLWKYKIKKDQCVILVLFNTNKHNWKAAF